MLKAHRDHFHSVGHALDMRLRERDNVDNKIISPRLLQLKSLVTFWRKSQERRVKATDGAKWNDLLVTYEKINMENLSQSDGCGENRFYDQRPKYEIFKVHESGQSEFRKKGNGFIPELHILTNRCKTPWARDTGMFESIHFKAGLWVSSLTFSFLIHNDSRSAFQEETFPGIKVGKFLVVGISSISSDLEQHEVLRK